MSISAFLNGFAGLLKILADARDGVAGGQGETPQQQNSPSFHLESPRGKIWLMVDGLFESSENRAKAVEFQPKSTPERALARRINKIMRLYKGSGRHQSTVSEDGINKHSGRFVKCSSGSGMAGILQLKPPPPDADGIGSRSARRFRQRRKPVIKMIVVSICVSLGAAAGWRLGAGFGLMTSYFLGLFGASAGLYIGRQFGRNYLD